jgi:hypothetical protein
MNVAIRARSVRLRFLASRIFSNKRLELPRSNQWIGTFVRCGVRARSLISKDEKRAQGDERCFEFARPRNASYCLVHIPPASDSFVDLAVRYGTLVSSMLRPPDGRKSEGGLTPAATHN